MSFSVGNGLRRSIRKYWRWLRYKGWTLFPRRRAHPLRRRRHRQAKQGARPGPVRLIAIFEDSTKQKRSAPRKSRTEIHRRANWMMRSSIAHDGRTRQWRWKDEFGGGFVRVRGAIKGEMPLDVLVISVLAVDQIFRLKAFKPASARPTVTAMPIPTAGKSPVGEFRKSERVRKISRKAGSPLNARCTK